MDALLAESSQSSPSLIVLWVEDPVSCLSAKCIELLAQSFERTPIVVVCTDIQRWEVRAALAAGAAGVVLDDDLDSALGPCLQAVLAGQTCVPRGTGARSSHPRYPRARSRSLAWS